MKLTANILVVAALAGMAFGQTAVPGSPLPVSQNPASQNPTSQKMLCVFLDLNAMSPAEQAKAQAAAAQFIQEKAAPTDLVEIATYTTKFNVIQDFTGDRDSLLAALKTLKPSASDNDSTGRMTALQAATASLNGGASESGLIYVTTAPGTSNYMAALNAIRFNANGAVQPVGVSLLPIGH